MTSRRGRRPTVKHVYGDDYEVKVGEQVFTFRAGSDGKLRALGTPDRSTEDFSFAKTLVRKTLIEDRLSALGAPDRSSEYKENTDE